MSGVTSIGNNAFSMCTSLENLKLPASIAELGTSVVKNIPNPIYARASEERMLSLNPNWNYDGNIIYGNTITYSKYPSDENFLGYAIDAQQNLAPTNEPLTIYSWCYADENDGIGAPLLNIGVGAFNSFEVPSITLKHPDGSNLNHKINIQGYAFSSMKTDAINIETDIEMDDEGFVSEGIFSSSNEVKSITIPDSLNSIPDSTFSYCSKLIEIKNTNHEILTNHLSNKILSIGADAFNGCYSLPELYINENIEYIGDRAFYEWGKNPDNNYPMQNVYINTLGENDNWGRLWNIGCNIDRCNIEFTAAKDYTIKFMVDQDNVVNPEGNDTKIVPRKGKLEDINGLTNPKSDSHNFTGIWYTTKERTEGTEFAIDKPINKDLVLYAGWEIKHFDKTFIENKYLRFYKTQGEDLTGKTLTFEYGQTIQFYVVMNGGYELPEIKYNETTLLPNSGNIYSITVENNANFSVSAKLITYTIIYENCKYAKNPNPTEYTVETPTIEFKDPEWEAYHVGTWNIRSIPTGSHSNKTITAIWSNPVDFAIIYKSEYDNVFSEYNPKSNPTTYNIESPTIIFDVPKWDAYNNCSWEVSEIPTGSWGMKTIKAVWKSPRQFKIIYSGLKDGSAPSSNPKYYTFETPNIELANPEWIAYDKASWDMPIIYSKTHWNDLTINAIWEIPHNFEIKYENMQNGSYGSNPRKYNIESEDIILQNPTRNGYAGSFNINVIPNGSVGDKTITAIWVPNEYRVITIMNFLSGNSHPDIVSYQEHGPIYYDTPFTIDAYKVTGYPFKYWSLNGEIYSYQERIVVTGELLDKCVLKGPYQNKDGSYSYSTNSLQPWYEDNCIAEGSMITLADGSQKAVQDLNGNEQLLVWNLFTGTFDAAPILFIDKDAKNNYEIIHLYFSDGTEVKIIGEHAFWDIDLNKYMFLRRDAAKYIGHRYNKQILNDSGNMIWTAVELIDVKVYNEVTTSWSPVTYSYLCYYVNGMLTMPGATEGFINLFEIDAETMKINEEAYNSDIEKYGILKYEEVSNFMSEEVFQAFNGKYLKISIGKGLITWDEILCLLDRYSEFFN